MATHGDLGHAMHEQFLQVSEKAYGECASVPKSEKVASAPADRYSVAFFRSAGLKALYTLSSCSSSSSTLWIMECFIIWLQVSALSCALHLDFDEIG
jgi:hypothetical protein